MSVKQLLFPLFLVLIFSSFYILAQNSKPEAPVLTKSKEQNKDEKLERATFSMYCYWTGEAALGTLPGVKKTKIGSLDYSEVVEVFYNPEETNIQEMTSTLKSHNSYYSTLYRTEEEKKAALSFLSQKEVKAASKNVSYIDDKHSLKVRFPILYEMKLSDEQALRLNSWAHYGRGPMPKVLTEKQLEELKQKIQ